MEVPTYYYHLNCLKLYDLMILKKLLKDHKTVKKYQRL